MGGMDLGALGGLGGAGGAGGQVDPNQIG